MGWRVTTADNPSAGSVQGLPLALRLQMPPYTDCSWLCNPVYVISTSGTFFSRSGDCRTHPLVILDSASTAVVFRLCSIKP